MRESDSSVREGSDGSVTEEVTEEVTEGVTVQ